MHLRVCVCVCVCVLKLLGKVIQSAEAKYGIILKMFFLVWLVLFSREKKNVINRKFLISYIIQVLFN